MSASAKITKNTALTTPKYTTTNEALLERLRIVETALAGEKSMSPSREEGKAKLQIKEWRAELLAEGGYNQIWLVSYTVKRQDSEDRAVDLEGKVIIREPNTDSSPYQIVNEIAFLTYLAEHHPSIPVPKVYAYSTQQLGYNSPFIAMEYIDGHPLDVMWSALSLEAKGIIANEIAQVIVNLGEIDLGGIGGLTLEHTLGPIVEGIKLFRGRNKFHSPSCYDIGPYASTHAYVIACYDKDIYYYTHASSADLGEDLFEYEGQRSKYVEHLRATRDNLFSDPSPFPPQEPLALAHGDFCGRNIMVHDGHVRAIIDWEFAGSYPLSELLRGSGVELFELDDDSLREYGMWSDRINEMAVEKARARGWDEERIELLVGEGNMEL